MVQQIIHILSFVINFDSKKNIFLMQVGRERERERERESERESERERERGWNFLFLLLKLLS